MERKPTYEELEQRVKALEEAAAEGRRAQDALEKSESNLKIAQELVSIGFWEKDVATGKVTWSDMNFKILGYAPKAFEPTFEDFQNRVHPEEREYIRQYTQKLLTGEIPFRRVDFRVIRPDGSVRFVNGHGRVVRDAQGKALRVFGTHLDITDRKLTEMALRESEEKYKILTEHSLIGVFIHQDGKYVHVNDTFAAMHGYRPEELIDKKFSDLIAPESEEISKQRVSSRLKDEPIPERFEVLRLHKDGSRLWCELIARRIEYRGRPAIMGHIVDIKERKQAQQALESAKKNLEKKVEARTADLKSANKELEIKRGNLEEVNTALRVLLRKRDEDKKEMERDVLSNVEELVEPYLEKLKNTGLDETQKAFVEIIESNLNDIVSPLIKRLSSRFLSLTPMEIQIANLVKQGRRTKDIANILNLSDRTIRFHRENIRSKIGVKHRKANLRSRLMTFL